ncbi:MAG: 23S rRNA (pseudouridine(1915)-N(3))-methyltransferase RlmH [Myxococcota bacterium]
MQVRIVAVGKIRKGGLREVLDDYFSRIKRYVRFEEIELRDDRPSVLLERLKREFDPRTRVVAMEVQGRTMTSGDLADYLGGGEHAGVQRLTCLIGGAYGLPSVLSEQADLQLSLSRMTLPHRLARLVLAEQLYRAYTILRCEPYAH